MYFVFTHMPGESYHRRLWSLLWYLCYAFQALINSLVCWYHLLQLQHATSSLKTTLSPCHHFSDGDASDGSLEDQTLLLHKCHLLFSQKHNAQFVAASRRLLFSSLQDMHKPGYLKSKDTHSQSDCLAFQLLGIHHIQVLRASHIQVLRVSCI